MELEITKTVEINLDIIKTTICKTGCSVREAIRQYVDRLGDDEYYLIGKEEVDKIIDELRKDGFED